MAFLATSALFACGCVVPATGSLPRCAPEKAGIDPAGILAFVDELEREDLETHSFMLVRHGEVVAEGWWAPCGPKDKHMLYSLSKSFMSTALGIAVSRGKLSLGAKVSEFFPEDMPETVSENLAEMRVRDLLCMACGQETEPMSQMFDAPDGNYPRAFLAHPVPFKPGTHFLYNTAGSYMLSAIVQKATGQTLSQILADQVYEPLGIKGAVWDQSPAHVDFGGFGLRASTEDIAKFGLLYLKHGVWNGEQILPKGWVEKATSKKIENGTDPNSDWAQGYGYQFWMCRHGNYRGDGAFGQFCIVMPKYDAVLAITGGGGDMQKTLNAVWTDILPAFDRAPSGPADLAKRLKGLSLPYPTGERTSPTAERVSGKLFKANLAASEIKSVRFDFAPDRVSLTLPEGSVQIGLKGWRRGQSVLFGASKQQVVARGAWKSPTVFVAKILNPAAPWSVTLTARFEGDALTVERSQHGTFGPSEQPTFEGKAK
jgi:CubicO group peptidase (beta-lactamase class C family)